VKRGGGSASKPRFLGNVFPGRFLGFVDVEDLAQFHQVENFFDILVDIAHSQRDLRGLAFFAEKYQFADHGRRHETDVLEVQNDFRVVRVIDQFRQLLPEAVDSGFVNDSYVLKIRNQNAVFVASEQCCHNGYPLIFLKAETLVGEYQPETLLRIVN
jgi:hypothetical protein